MDSQLFVEYIIVDTVGKKHISESHDEAVEFFRKGWEVYERHMTIVKVSKFTTSTQTVITAWNGNPLFERRTKK